MPSGVLCRLWARLVTPLVLRQAFLLAQPVAVRRRLKPTRADHRAVGGACTVAQIHQCRRPASNFRYCSTVTALAARANVRPIRFLCCNSSCVPPFSVGGDPITNSTGPGITTIVCPWPLTYHCGRAFSLSFGDELLDALQTFLPLFLVLGPLVVDLFQPRLLLPRPRAAIPPPRAAPDRQPSRYMSCNFGSRPCESLAKAPSRHTPPNSAARPAVWSRPVPRPDA